MTRRLHDRIGGAGLIMAVAFGSLLIGCDEAGIIAHTFRSNKVDAVYRIENRSTAVLVDDPSVPPRLPTPDLSTLIAARLGEALAEADAVSNVISAVRDLAAREENFHRWPIDRIGDAVGAEQVIYVHVDAFELTEDGVMYRPRASARVKVVDAASGERLFPARGQGDSLAVTTKMPYQSMEGATATTNRIIGSRLAEQLARQIARLFYKHKAPEPGDRVDQVVDDAVDEGQDDQRQDARSREAEDHHDGERAPDERVAAEAQGQRGQTQDGGQRGKKDGAEAHLNAVGDVADGASGVDLVVEAVPERAELKYSLFEALDEAADPETILASNTSSISITEIAERTNRPDKVVGMHFMNPVPVMRLVEVIRGLATSDETARAVVTLSEALGKTPVEVNDFPGFVSNRVLMPMINEAVFALMEGVADRSAIDTVMKLGMNHPMGPLGLADLIGLDTCLNILEVLHRELGDDRYRPCPLLRKYVAAGWLGRKSGRGFYEYE